jgi:1-acyl-sn-glycerol-3-phosphate acyltransferase
LLEFRNGSFRGAAKTGCPVIPVALVDCYKVLDQKGSKSVSVQIHYLEPIYHQEYKDLNTKELAALVRDRIEAKVKQCTQ